MDNVGSEAAGEAFARQIRLWLPDFGITLLSDTRYLALGAGRAISELEFAKYLDIKHSNTTLLDIIFSQEARARFQEVKFSGSTVEDNMYEFLEKPREGKFDVISLFSMDNVLDTEEKLGRLIAGLSVNLNPNGVAMIVPYRGPTEITPIWTKYGFTSLRKAHEGIKPSSYMMILTKPRTT